MADGSSDLNSVKPKRIIKFLFACQLHSWSDPAQEAQVHPV